MRDPRYDCLQIIPVCLDLLDALDRRLPDPKFSSSFVFSQAPDRLPVDEGETTGHPAIDTSPLIPIPHLTMTICPNCGSHHAERFDLTAEQMIRIQCPDCDYFLLACTKTHRPIEVYAPGINLNRTIDRLKATTR
jgi:predicted RNA-binding Zn-ribbon protein involved in translation (DUF1610 family)